MSQAYLRDVQLDMYRGLLMIYIVCVIHVSGWLDYFNEPYSNLLLWEMPAIFYVAGASASLAAKKGFIEQFKNRLKRVYYPYLLLALLYITAMVLLYALPSHPASFTNLISEYNLYDWVSVFWGGYIHGLPYTWHLWFVVPYLLISTLFTFERKWVEKYKTLFVICNITLYLFVLFLQSKMRLHNVWVMSLIMNIEYIFAYNIFYIAGFLTYKKLSYVKTVAIMLGLLFLITLVTRGSIPPLRELKFPPTLIFILYGFWALSCLALILHYIKIPRMSLFEEWNRSGYTIYLYQGVVFYIYKLTIHQPIYDLFDGSIFGFVLEALLIFLFLSILQLFILPIERLFVEKLSIIY